MRKFMKSMVRIAMAPACLAALAMASGCASTGIRRVSGEEFMRQGAKISEISSFNWTSCIGASGQRAYLETGRPAFIGRGAKTTVLWVPLSELPEDAARKFREGESPWKSWISVQADGEKGIR